MEALKEGEVLQARWALQEVSASTLRMRENSHDDQGTVLEEDIEALGVGTPLGGSLHLGHALLRRAHPPLLGGQHRMADSSDDIGKGAGQEQQCRARLQMLTETLGQEAAARRSSAGWRGAKSLCKEKARFWGDTQGFGEMCSARGRGSPLRDYRMSSECSENRGKAQVVVWAGAEEEKGAREKCQIEEKYTHADACLSVCGACLGLHNHQSSCPAEVRK